MPLISIIILNYKTPDITKKCISSIFDNYQKEIKDGKIEIIVADNASGDDSLEKLKKIKGIKLVENKENYGFGKGINMASKNATGEYFLFLNSDTQVFDKSFLDMVSFLKKNIHVGIMGGKLKNADGSTQPSCGEFYTLKNFFIMVLGGEKFGFIRKNPSKIASVDWVSGASMMIRADIFKKINGFDEDYFMYMEDMDICFRIKKLGYQVYFYPNIKIEHAERASSNKTFAIVHIYKGLLLFYKKHMPLWQYHVIRYTLLLKAFILKSLGRQTYAEAFEVIR